MADMAEPPMTANVAHLSKISRAMIGGALARRVKNQPFMKSFQGGMEYAVPYAFMWRGNVKKYRYTTANVARWGEGDTKTKYHQYFSHAKCPTDYTKAGKDFEFMIVERGKTWIKPLPTVQYIPKNAKPKWNFKSWSDPLNSHDIWQRELHYEEHIPTHLNCKRPLAVLAPGTKHNHFQFAYMEKITITISPFLFGFGRTVQKAVLDFYRLCVSARSIMPRDKVVLLYTIDALTPSIEVTWLDQSTYRPPLAEGSNAFDLLQMVMEQAWLVGDRLTAAGVPIQPLLIDDYKWAMVAQYIKKKVKKETPGKAAAPPAAGKK